MAKVKENMIGKLVSHKIPILSSILFMIASISIITWYMLTKSRKPVFISESNLSSIPLNGEITGVVIDHQNRRVQFLHVINQGRRYYFQNYPFWYSETHEAGFACSKLPINFECSQQIPHGGDSLVKIKDSEYGYLVRHLSNGQSEKIPFKFVKKKFAVLIDSVMNYRLSSDSISDFEKNRK